MAFLFHTLSTLLHRRAVLSDFYRTDRARVTTHLEIRETSGEDVLMKKSGKGQGNS